MSQVAHDVKEKVRTGDVLISENIDFNGLLLSEQVLKGLKNAGFLKPSPIQLKAIPLGRCGLDLIVQAKSGTGKTCVFSVIALETLHTDAISTQVLVLAPTREIAVQIRDVINSIGSAIEDLQCHTFIGGLPLHEDKVKLKKCHVAVGSPGRVKQLIESGVLRTDSVRLFVLDEADKLLEESFQEQINWIYSTLPENKQMLALSATYPEYLADHLTAYMRNPTFLRLNISDPALLGIRQYYQTVKHHPISHVVFEEKCKILTTILSSVSFQQCLVFSNLQTRAQNLAESLTKHGWPTACIAGCLDQKDRNHAMEKLKTYKCRILISTDLTSRGIDADKVNLVINMDVPKDHETYLHRIGRAGRFGTFGIAVTLVSEGLEKQNLTSIEKRSNTHIHTLPDPLPSDLAKAGSPVYLDDMVSSEVINTGQHLNITKTGQIQIGDHGNTTVPETLIGSHGNTTAPGPQIGNHDNTTSPETQNESLPEANFTELEIRRADKTSSESHITSLSKNMSSESQNDSSVKSSRSEVSPGSYDMITPPETQTSIIGNYDKPVSLQTAQEITSSSLISLHQKDLKKTPFSESETHKFHSSNCEDTLELNQEPANQNYLSSGLFKNESNLSLKDLKSCTPTAAVNHKEQVFETSSLEFNTENGQFQHFSGSHCSVAPMYRIQDKNTSDISKELKKKSFNKKTGYNSVCEEVNDHEVDTNVNDFESTTKTVLQTDNQSKVNVIESEVTKVTRVPVDRIKVNCLYHKLRLGEINLSQAFKKGIGYKTLEKTHTYNSATQDLKSFRESENFRSEEEIEKKPDLTFVIPHMKEDANVIESEDSLQEAVEQLQDLFEQNINLVYRHGLEQNGIEEIENEEIHQVVKTSVEISTKDTNKLKLPKHAVKCSIDQIQEPDLEQFSDDYIGRNARIDGTSEYLEKENLFIAYQSNSIPDKQKMVQSFPSESVTNQNNSNSNTRSKARRQRLGYQRNFAIGHMLQQERLNNVDKEVDSAAVETNEEMNINSGRGLDDFSLANFMEDEDSKVDNYSKLDRSNSNQSEQNVGTHGDLNGLNRFETESMIQNYKKIDEIQVEAGNFCYAKDKPTSTEEHEAEARLSDTDETESEVSSSDYTADSESDSLEESNEEIKLAERKNEKSLKFRKEKYFSSQSESVDYDSRAHHSLNAGEFRKQSYPTPSSRNAAPYYSCYPNGNYGYQYPGYNSYPASSSHPQQPAFYQHPSLPYQQFVPAFPQPYGHVNRHLSQTSYDSHSGSSLWYQQPWIYGHHGNSNAYLEQIAQNNDPSLKKTFDIQSEYIKKMCKNEDKSGNDKKKKKHQQKYARN